MARLCASPVKQRVASIESTASADSFATASEGDVKAWPSAEEELANDDISGPEIGRSRPKLQQRTTHVSKKVSSRSKLFKIFDEDFEECENGQSKSHTSDIADDREGLLEEIDSNIIRSTPHKQEAVKQQFPICLGGDVRPLAVLSHVEEDITQSLNSTTLDVRPNLFIHSSSPWLATPPKNDNEPKRPTSPINYSGTSLSPSLCFSTSSLSHEVHSGSSCEDDTTYSDDSLVDFIVSDSASESELRRPYLKGRKKENTALPSPRKSPRKIVLDSDSDSDSEGKRESSSTTPEILASKLASMSISRPLPFDRIRAGLATSLLADLDAKVTRGAVTAIARRVPIEWSNSMKTAAGYAVFKRLPSRPLSTDCSENSKTDVTTVIRLASSIIKTEAQLRATLAHEFCHVAVYHVDGVRNAGHGKLFKKWARKVEKHFVDVKVTTKHVYEVDLKFAWKCKICGHMYRRATRSVDVTKRVCKCGGRLEFKEEEMDEEVTAGQNHFP